ncbi:MAG TPA: copper chaperone PCu(A)C [Pusillimonas sp.]|uniref:copper chaperone PCu(A)C n=1 Tax=Pusillimonas sp. TaxID=3040095 RepID=UPI002B865AA1|nr:copper chaperone PCu(A)C [Pusillimonas sp.]HUH88608.1 copper chaperone PCu(A)C [Pusillimonas sp.]
MKHVILAGLTLLGATSMALSGTVHASASGVQLAQAHGHHSGAGGHGHGQASGVAAPSQHAIAAMPLSKSVVISDCWIRLLPLPAPSAGYFVAANQGDKPVTLAGAASAKYGAVMLHQTTHSDGMSRMSSVNGVEIAAHEKLEFKPGGYHIMLEKPAGEIKVGDAIPLQFLFASGEKAEAQCAVKPANTVAR